MANPVVIDISHWQPDPIDWDAVKANGTMGVIHKATESTGYVDEDLFHRAADAMDAGLLWSTYHFLRPGSMQKQMDHYLATVDPQLGERVCLDHEDRGVSLVDLCDCVKYLMHERPDLQIAIYSGHVIKEQLGNSHNALLAENTSLWIAHYTSAAAPSWPKGTWPTWSLWQYSDKARAIGISGNIDGDRWNGSVENLVAWFGPAAAVPTPPPGPAPEAVPMSIVLAISQPGMPAPASIKVDVTWNGEIVG